MFKRSAQVAAATLFLAIPSVWAGPIADRLIAAGTDPLHRADPLRVARKERMITFMPKPQPVDSSGSCQKTELRYESNAAKSKAGWSSFSYESNLNEWAVGHWGARAGSRQRGSWCVDGDFAARAWQAALGEPPTGILTALQMAKLVNVVDNLDESQQRHKERQALVRRDRGEVAPEEAAEALLLADIKGNDDGATVPAFGLSVGAPMALPVCPTANAADPARICIAQGRADRAHPNRALEFHRMDVFVPDGSNQTVTDGMVSIQFPLRQRPDFLPKNLVGLRGLVSQGRLVGLSGFVEPNIDMVGRFREQYGEPVLTRIGIGSSSRLVLSFKTANGTAKLDCDGQAIKCTFAQVLTHTAPKLLQEIMLAANQEGGDSVRVSRPEGEAERRFREEVQRRNSDMAESWQRGAERARREEAEETERVRRQNEEIRRLQEDERCRRAAGN